MKISQGIATLVLTTLAFSANAEESTPSILNYPVESRLTEFQRQKQEEAKLQKERVRQEQLAADKAERDAAYTQQQQERAKADEARYLEQKQAEEKLRVQEEAERAKQEAREKDLRLASISKQFNKSVPAVDVVLRRVLKILNGNNGGPEKIIEAARLLDSLVESHHDFDLLDPRRLEAFQALAKDASETKSRLKKDPRVLTSDEAKFIVSDLESRSLCKPETLQVLKFQFVSTYQYIAGIGLEAAVEIPDLATYPGPSRRAGKGFIVGTETDSLGRKSAVVCNYSYETDTGCGVLGAYYHFKAKDGQAESHMYAGWGAFVLAFESANQDPDFQAKKAGLGFQIGDPKRNGLLYSNNHHAATVVARPFSIGRDYSVLRKVLGIVPSL